MKKCLITKLAESVSDSSLPVFENVVFHNYAIKSQADQYIDVGSIISGLNYANMKIEVVAKFTANVPVRAVNDTLFLARGSVVWLVYRNGAFSIIANGANGTPNSYAIKDENIDKNVDINIGLTFDENRYATMSFGEYTHTSEIQTSSGGTQKYGQVLGGTSAGGTTLLKSFKLTRISDNTLLLDLVPATVNGVACLYNLVDNTPLYPNEGNLTLID